MRVSSLPIHSFGLGLLLFACAGVAQDKKSEKPTGYVAHKYQSDATSTERQYVTYIPADYNANSKNYPLLVFLHGASERGDDPEKLKVNSPLKVAIREKDSSFPINKFIIVAPQVPGGARGGAAAAPAATPAAASAPASGSASAAPAADTTPARPRVGGWPALDGDIVKILAEVKKDYRVDESRMYLTGLSLGGFGTFAFAAAHPGIFAAIAPLCGGGNAAQANKYKGTPFWVFHGDADRTVPISRSQEMVDAMKADGQDPKFTIYPGVGHDCWTQTYDNPELYNWFLSHQLKK